MLLSLLYLFFFFFNDTATTEIYTLSLHDALPISGVASSKAFPDIEVRQKRSDDRTQDFGATLVLILGRSEEHTSELQSHSDLVCRLLLEKKKQTRQLTQ